MNVTSYTQSRTYPKLEAGRHTAYIAGLVDVGLQAAFDSSRPPVQSVAVVFKLGNGVELVKKFSISFHPMSSLSGLFQSAIGVTLDSAQAWDIAENFWKGCPTLLGAQVAVELGLSNGGIKLLQVSPVEPFDDVLEVPEIGSDVVVSNLDERLIAPDAKAWVMGLNQEVRRFISLRIRPRMGA